MTTKKRVFEIAGGTAPTAEDSISQRETSRPRAVQPPPADAKRNSFTWRQSADQQDALDDLARLVRRALGRRVDKADILAALVDLTNASKPWRSELLARLGDQEE